MIAIIDYGMGNLRSVHKAFTITGHEAIVTRDARLIGSADRLVLPGVGAFGDCMKNLAEYGLIDPIRTGVAAGKPFLGICLGLQVLFTESEEFGLHKGLDIIPGRVRRFPAGALKVPHIGWNAVSIKREAPPLRDVKPADHFYFVHSYQVEPADPAVVATTTEYGGSFVSSIWRDNIFACQFHPEKSQRAGLRLIDQFARWS